MEKGIFWNRRSGADRRDSGSDLAYAPAGEGSDRRSLDRRLYGDNGYILIVGDAGLDRFTLFVSFPALVLATASLAIGSFATF